TVRVRAACAGTVRARTVCTATVRIRAARAAGVGRLGVGGGGGGVVVLPLGQLTPGAGRTARLQAHGRADLLQLGASLRLAGEGCGVELRGRRGPRGLRELLLPERGGVAALDLVADLLERRRVPAPADALHRGERLGGPVLPLRSAERRVGKDATAR